jgi:tRNA pseudouridine38/39 synthase
VKPKAGLLLNNFSVIMRICKLIAAYDMCELTLVGQAYLWHQVRCIMGVLLLIGQGKEETEIMKQLLDIEKHPM